LETVRPRAPFCRWASGLVHREIDFDERPPDLLIYVRSLLCHGADVGRRSWKFNNDLDANKALELLGHESKLSPTF
ncbi:MAG: hypothetical protein M3P52_11910, partial [Actinomycetota bacterium]|nr:hypothetical protein [Actinomycetota bacterium]